MLTDRRRGRRWWPRNWRWGTKHLVVLLVPLLLAGVLGGLRVAGELDRAGALEAYGRQVGFARQASAVLGELQRERTLGCELVAQRPDGDRATVGEQMRRVDTGLAVLPVPRGLLDGLAVTREAALETGLPVEAVMTGYSSTIDALRERRDAALAGAPPPMRGRAESLRELGTVAEQVSRQHAVLLAGLRAGELSAVQQAALRVTHARLGAAPVAGIAADDRARLVDLALQRSAAGTPLGITPQQWDAAAAATGARVRDAASALSGRLRTDTLELAADLRGMAVRDGVVLAVFGLLTMVLLALVVRSLVRPLRLLRSATFDVADRRLPEVFRRVRAEAGPLPAMSVDPIPVYGREDLGHLARAVDAVHNEAVRLAGEQAALRSDVNDAFVTLSRRSQELAARLLVVLESMRRDPDPAQPFQLDHLAIRMRRTSESLLVLGGAEPPPRSGDPVDLLDALRTAAFEVEHFDRIVVRHPPEAAVDGALAADLVHLIAELLDNATSFSDPDTEVVVSASTVAGGLLIEIADAGVGMPVDALHETNDRLATSDAAGVAPDRRTGLFVVGRLARRHGLRVQLRRNPPGRGLSVAVEVPAAHLQVGAQPPRRAADRRRPGPDLRVPMQVSAAGLPQRGRHARPDPGERTDPEQG
ncbi:MAG: HAMP domain-containing protein [Pseudonocardiaceae bacterium]|nr:HAMP domain-containing protein [Pseudonocardiaceae bacterium]